MRLSSSTRSEEKPTADQWFCPSEDKAILTFRLSAFIYQVILGDISGPAENLYFIQSGKCKVVREMTLFRKTLASGKSRLTLPPIHASHGHSKKTEKKFLTIHILKKGDFFGVGEDLTKTYITSVGRVSTLILHVKRPAHAHQSTAAAAHRKRTLFLDAASVEM